MNFWCYLSSVNQVTVLGDAGEDILYASLSNGDLSLQFEYFASEQDPHDYEFIFTVKPKDFPLIAKLFGLDENADILSNIQKISDAGRGQEFKEALNEERVPREIFTWLS